MKTQPVKKNQVITVEIVDLTHEGLGVAKIEGYPIFIENALPEEQVSVQIVKVGNKFGYGKVLEWLKTSDERVPLKDQTLLRTGIAPLQHMTYESQLKFKQMQVEKALNKIAKINHVNVEETIGMAMPSGYRNKAQVPVRKLNEQLATGFFRKNSHDLVEIEDYFIQDPKIDQAILIIREIVRKFGVKAYHEKEHTGNLRHIIVRRGHYSHEMMVILVTRTEKIFKYEQIVQAIITELPETVAIIQNINSDQTNVILGKTSKKLYGRNYLEDQLLGKTYRISPQSFYQVNTVQAEVLYETARQFADLKPEDVVIDAYCGIGTISLSIADDVKHVYGVEVVPSAIEDAKSNAKHNHVNNVTFETGSAENVMKKWQEQGIQPNVVIVDPPRKGLMREFISASCEMQPEKVVYVSCNPATMARDIQLYQEQGYQLTKVQPVDMFPQTYHVETIALLQRR